MFFRVSVFFFFLSFPFLFFFIFFYYRIPVVAQAVVHNKPAPSLNLEVLKTMGPPTGVLVRHSSFFFPFFFLSLYLLFYPFFLIFIFLLSMLTSPNQLFQSPCSRGLVLFWSSCYGNNLLLQSLNGLHSCLTGGWSLGRLSSWWFLFCPLSKDVCLCEFPTLGLAASISTVLL